MSFSGFIKLIELCDLYHKKKPELTKNEQYEIVEYGKSRFFVLVTQMKEFLEILKGSYGSMNPYQKNEIATFLVPEVSRFSLLIVQFCIFLVSHLLYI